MDKNMVAAELLKIAKSLNAATDVHLEHYRFIGALSSLGHAVNDFREALRNDGRPGDGDQFYLAVVSLITEIRQLSDKYVRK